MICMLFDLFTDVEIYGFSMIFHCWITGIYSALVGDPETSCQRLPKEASSTRGKLPLRWGGKDLQTISVILSENYHG